MKFRYLLLTILLTWRLDHTLWEVTMTFLVLITDIFLMNTTNLVKNITFFLSISSFAYSKGIGHMKFGSKDYGRNITFLLGYMPKLDYRCHCSNNFKNFFFFFLRYWDKFCYTCEKYHQSTVIATTYFLPGSGFMKWWVTLPRW